MHNSTLAFKGVDSLFVPRPPPELTPRVSLDDLAILAVVDFQQSPAFTVDAHRRIGEALQDMMNFGVRSLLVVNRQRELLGLVTAYDIMGEQPILYLQGPQCPHDVCSSYEDVRVADIMTATHDLPFLDFDDLLYAKVRELVKLFGEVGASHFLVVTHDETHNIVTGIVSATEVARQLGIDVEVACTAQGLADLYRTFENEWQ